MKSKHKNKEYLKKRRRKLTSEGICYRCGKAPITKKTHHCIICLLKKIAHGGLGDKNRYHDLKKLFIQQEQKCPYTGVQLIIGENASLDHIIPKSKGGSDHNNNLQWVCKWINTAKSDLTREEFLIKIKQAYFFLNESVLS